MGEGRWEGGWMGKWEGEWSDGWVGGWVGHTATDTISPLPDLIPSHHHPLPPHLAPSHTTTITATSCHPSGPSPHLCPSPTPLLHCILSLYSLGRRP